METLAHPPNTVKPPLETWPFFDRVQCWIKKPLDRATIAKLKKLCGGRLYTDSRHPARFDFSYRQRLDFKQPADAALAWIASRDDALVNMVEPALDHIFRNWAERDDCEELLDCCSVR